MLSEEEFNSIEKLIWGGMNMRDAVRFVTGSEPSMLLIMWLATGGYHGRFTDAKKGDEKVC
jgi:hypothetical protein